MDKMSKEQAANILDPETSREALRPYIYDPDRRLAVVEEACRVAAKALRFVSSTEPLTIDSSGWTDEEVESIKKMLHECSAIVQIPESILSAPPAHIDREAWEPCGELCRNNCMTCDHNADELFGDADYCKDCHRCSKWESSVHKFCERCGRPKTPEAWAELEKRLRG